jgi:RNA polymerase sigma-70 factor (ECF subfamily)
VTAAYLLAALGSDDGHRTPASRAHLEAEDAALVASIRAGDEPAFEQVYRAYHAAMWDVAYRYVRDESAAEDAVQDVFRMVWERRASLSVTGTLATYLFGAVRHRALNMLRHLGVARRAAETFSETDVPGLGGALQAPDAETAIADLDAQVLRYINALPERTRTLVMLRWKHGLSYAEIAAALGMSGDAAKKLGQRVHAVLRPLIEELREP